MTSLFVWFLTQTTLLISSHGFAQTIYSETVPFFRTIQSPFPSGQLRKEVLNEKQIQKINIDEYLVKKDNQIFRVASQNLLRDLDLANKVQKINTGDIGEIIDKKSDRYIVRFTNGITEELSAQDLTPDSNDPGYAFILFSHPIRIAADPKSEIIQTAEAGTKFKISNYNAKWSQNKFIQIQLDTGRIGYVLLSECLLKIDFSSFIFTKNKTWYSYSYRDQNEIVLNNSKKILIAEVTAVLTRPDLGILTKKLDSEAAPNGSSNKLVARSTVKIISQETQNWVESNIPEHGVIYWREATNSEKKLYLMSSSMDKNKITTDELLKREIFQVAFNKNNPDRAIASAEGVFITENGKTWEQITAFNNQNLPVQIGNKGEYYVGSLYSKDGGKNFKPYLRWEDLTHLIERKFKKTPGTLKISDINFQNTKLHLNIDTGIYKMQIIGTPQFGLVTDWKIHGLIE